jgi:N-acetylated-alpha-linked acidic dipeptidase
MKRTLRLCLSLGFVALLLGQSSPNDAPIRGFSPQHLAAERDLEKKLQAVPQADRLREYMKFTSGQPHHAGHPNSKRVAEYILAKYKSWGLDARLEEFEALMPYPKERVVELTQPTHYRLQLKEPVIPEDQNSSDPDQLPTFNAYSADGDVTAQVVYVNYGRPEDYDELARQQIDVKGKIVLARYGVTWRGIKPKVAYEHGAIGCIIYSDPREDGYERGDVYPEGPYRPEQGVQRGSVMDMPTYPGDPLTPGWAGEKGGRKLTRAEAKTLMKIPVLPISYGDALPILKALRGPVVPEAWKGALPVTYHMGPGPAVVHLKLVFDWQVRPLFDVVVRIPGRDFPDEWVIRGNHHDAWVNGADDPLSGQAAMMEEAHAFSELLKTGWRPRRTIIICSWDGEEWGLLGSTEWAEKHAAELDKTGVFYLNSDTTAKGRLGASGSHILERFINEVERDINDPNTGKSLLAMNRERPLGPPEGLGPATGGGGRGGRGGQDAADRDRKDLRIGALGSGSDYTPFLQHLGVASANYGFGGEGNSAGVYHSIYDSFNWYTKFSDTTFVYGRTLAQAAGTSILRMADADVIPYEFGNFAETAGRYVDEVTRLPRDSSAPALDFKPLTDGIAALKKSAADYESALQGADLSKSGGAALDAALIKVERSLLGKGLPRREWYRHRIYAPGFYTGYGVKTLPGVREAIEQKEWNEAKAQIIETAAAFTAMSTAIDEATKQLK